MHKRSKVKRHSMINDKYCSLWINVFVASVNNTTSDKMGTIIAEIMFAEF